MQKQITLQTEGNVATIRIERPEALNALSRSLIDELDEALDAVAKDETLHALVVHSKDHFAAGADIKEMATLDVDGASAYSFTPTYLKLRRLDVPSIAVIEGYAFGGGLELALHCDLRLAASDAKMGLTELNLGIFPGAGGTVLLPRLVGEAKAREMILFSSVVSGEEAARIGLVNKAAPKAALVDTLNEWLARLKNKSRVSLAKARACILYASQTEYDAEKAMSYESKAWAELFASHDSVEGLRAFIEKRKPQFQDK